MGMLEFHFESNMVMQRVLDSVEIGFGGEEVFLPVRLHQLAL